MKNISVLLAGMVISAATMAQSPAPEPDTLTNPGANQGNPAPDNPPPVNSRPATYRADEVRVVPKDLPAPIRQTLESNPQYDGWEKNLIYKNRSGNIYSVEFKEGDRSKVYRFDKAGKPLPEK